MGRNCHLCLFLIRIWQYLRKNHTFGCCTEGVVAEGGRVYSGARTMVTDWSTMVAPWKYKTETCKIMGLLEMRFENDYVIVFGCASTVWIYNNRIIWCLGNSYYKRN